MTTKSKSQDKQKLTEIDDNISRLFEIKKRLGKGAYGIVWKALDKRTTDTVAVKKIFDAFRDETDAQRTFREIIFLKAFRNHPNIVKLQNVYKASNNLDIYLIFEYMESDLHNIIKKGTILKDIHKRYVMYQLINAVKYIHSGNVIHRDLKPSNVLIDSKCRCKLADFGLARSVSNRPARECNDSQNDISIQPLLTDYVATRWYRAPEILVASKRYTKGIDMWSLGCILGEMIRGKPLFQGSSTVNQIEKIISALPEITEDDIRAVGAGFGSALLNKQISKEKKISINDLLCESSRDALDLVKSLLVLDPLARLTAKQALNHPYVERFRNSIPEIELNVDVLPPFRDDIRLTVPEYRSKLYEIVQVNTEKSSIRDRVMDKLDDVKSHKSKKPLCEDKCVTKEKPAIKPLDKYEIESQPAVYATSYSYINNNDGMCTPNRNLNKASLKKSVTNISNISENICGHSKSHAYGYHKLSKQVENLSTQTLQKTTIHNTSIEAIPVIETADKSSKKPDISRKLYRSSSSLNKSDKNSNFIDSNRKQERMMRNTAMISNRLINKTQESLTQIRNTKSEVIQQVPVSQQNNSNTQERICYERRLKKLEEEIERYKKEVRSFCRQSFNFNNSDHNNNNNSSYNISSSNPHQCIINATRMEKRDYKRTPKSSIIVSSTPIQNTYFQLLTKGNSQNYNRSNFDVLQNPSKNCSSTNIEQFTRAHNTKSSSSRDKIVNHLHEHQLSVKNLQNPHRSRSISKFV